MSPCAAVVVKALEDEDVRFTVGFPGIHNIELCDELARAAFRRIVGA
jgi:thiamine pyrophosphate-dependent acetolactate synthase large subunit-like protein